MARMAKVGGDGLNSTPSEGESILGLPVFLGSAVLGSVSQRRAGVYSSDGDTGDCERDAPR